MSRRRVAAVGPHKRQKPSRFFPDLSSLAEPESEPESDSDSDVDSGYGSASFSADEDPDETAAFYDDLLDGFRKDGPTLADHGDDTKRMELAEEEKWNE